MNQLSFTQYMGVISINPINVGRKNASRKRVFSLGSLNLVTTFLMCLNAITIKAKKSVGRSNKSWCVTAPNRKFGWNLNLEISPVLAED